MRTMTPGGMSSPLRAMYSVRAASSSSRCESVALNSSGLSLAIMPRVIGMVVSMTAAIMRPQLISEAADKFGMTTT